MTSGASPTCPQDRWVYAFGRLTKNKSSGSFMRTCRCTSSREKAARWVVSGSESERTRDRSWFIFTFLIFILCFKGAFWQQMLTHMKPSLSVDVKITRWLSVNVRQFRIFTLFYNLHSLSYKMNHLGINPLRCSDAENKFTIHSRRLHEGVKNDMQTVKKTERGWRKTTFLRWDQSTLTAFCAVAMLG